MLEFDLTEEGARGLVQAGHGAGLLDFSLVLIMERRRWPSSYCGHMRWPHISCRTV
jgi:hypothetical protein